MKINSTKSFAIFERMNNKTNEKWTEILNLNKITCIRERRYGKGVYNNDPGKRNGYLVFAEGGDPNGFWINDYEYNELLKNEIFGIFNK